MFLVDTLYNVRSQLQRSDVMCKQLFLLSYSTDIGLICDAERDLLAIAKFLVIYREGATDADGSWRIGVVSRGLGRELRARRVYAS